MTKNRIVYGLNFCIALFARIATMIVFSILLPENTSGQPVDTIPEYLRHKLAIYTTAIPREEIFLHSDRDSYIAGENMWFTIYLTDRQSNKPSLNSRIAYVEILNPVNRPVAQKRILLNNGSGNGEVILSDTLSTGTYTLRAYTNWMKNFLPYNCFIKEIKIYNSQNSKSFRTKMASSNSIRKGISQDREKNGITSGITLNINNFKKDSLELFIDADEKYLSENKNIFYLLIQTRGNINHLSAEKTSAGKARMAISKSKLTAGINQVTIFNKSCLPVAERYIFTSKGESSIITIHSPDSFLRREEIKMEIEPVNDPVQEIIPTNISLSVSPVSKEIGIKYIDDYMIFGSEYGIPDQSLIRGRKIGDIPAEEIDNVLTDVKSNWIDWLAILTDVLPETRYHFEKEDHFFYGKLIKGDLNSSDISDYVFLCSPGKSAGFQYARTDSQGNFTFKLPIDYELRDMIVTPYDADKNIRIQTESSFSDKYFKSESIVDSTGLKMSVPVTDWCINYQVQRIYEASYRRISSDEVFAAPKLTRFYGKPDIELKLADYISLPTMEEVFFELLPHVSLKKNKSVWDLKITDRVDESRYELSPYPMIDGVLINDPSLIATLDPAIVEEIDVVKEKYRIGRFVFHGIVNVITKTGDFSCVQLPGTMIRFSYKPIEPSGSFVPTSHSNEDAENSASPDFRNTLYWDPSVKNNDHTGLKISFWSSDAVSEYEISLNGITNDGRFISARKVISVK